MLIAFGDHTIRQGSWPSKQALIEALLGCDLGYVMLGEDAEHVVDFHSVVVNLHWSAVHSFGVGVCSQGQGLSPGLLLQTERQRLLFGFNRSVVGVQFPEHQLAFRLELDSMFDRFMPIPHRHRVLVQHEIGVVALAEDGEVMWSYSKDIVTGFDIVGDDLRLQFMDHEPVTVSLLAGPSVATPGPGNVRS